jgi:hypothetical protein
MAARWHRVAFDVSVSDVDELEDVMAAHGWALDGEEPTVQARSTRVWFAPLDDDGGRNPPRRPGAAAGCPGASSPGPAACGTRRRR